MTPRPPPASSPCSPCGCRRRAGAGGRLFGSVSPGDIAAGGHGRGRPGSGQAQDRDRQPDQDSRRPPGQGEAAPRGQRHPRHRGRRSLTGSGWLGLTQAGCRSRPGSAQADLWRLLKARRLPVMPRRSVCAGRLGRVVTWRWLALAWPGSRPAAWPAPGQARRASPRRPPGGPRRRQRAPGRACSFDCSRQIIDGLAEPGEPVACRRTHTRTLGEAGSGCRSKQAHPAGPISARAGRCGAACRKASMFTLDVKFLMWITCRHCGLA